jgi:hypothetical protein
LLWRPPGVWRGRCRIPTPATASTVRSFLNQGCPRAQSALAVALLPALLAIGPAARAQTPTVPTVPELAIPTAPVEVDGVVLFRLRGATSVPAALRAGAWAERIQEAAQDPEVDPKDLKIVETDHGLELRVGDHLLGIVVEADARLEGLTAPELALAHSQAVKAAIVRYRAARTPMRLGTAAARALGATALLAALLALLLPLFRRIDRFVQRRFERRARELEAKSFELLRAHRLRAPSFGAPCTPFGRRSWLGSPTCT